MTVPISVSTLEALLADRAPEYVANGLAEKSFLYRRFRKTGPSDAQGPRWQVLTSANDSVGSFADGGALGTPGAATFTQATLRWGNYAGSFKLSDRQLKQLAEGSAEQLVNVIDENLMHVTRQIIDAVEADILTGTTDDQTIIGLSTAIANANTYSGIDRSAVSAFASPVANGGGDSITAADMLSAYNKVTYENLGRVTVGLCSNSILDTIRGFTTGDVSSSVQIMNNEAVMDGPAKFIQYTNVYFKTIPIIAVPGMASTYMYFLDEDDVAIEQLGGLEMMPVAREGGTGLNWVFTFRMYLQMRIRNPFKSTALVTSITT
jgi:hypothetical protein